LAGLGKSPPLAAGDRFWRQDPNQQDQPRPNVWRGNSPRFADTLQSQFEAADAHWRVPRLVMEQQQVCS
jgi:hypothetical protein